MGEKIQHFSNLPNSFIQLKQVNLEYALTLADRAELAPDSQNMSGSTDQVGHSAVSRKESVMGKKVKKICAKVL